MKPDGAAAFPRGFSSANGDKHPVIPPLLLILLAGLAAARAADFYVSPHGDDGASGESSGRAWRTLDRLNRHIADSGLKPGDRILLRGGSEFAGGIVISDAGGGTRERPAVVSTFGRGRATLACGGRTGILVRETPWITISNLVLKAGPGNDGDGIRFDRTQATGRRIAGATIQNCLATGFAWHGFMIDASQRAHGYEQVLVADSEATHNRHAGIMVYGGNPAGRTGHPHADVSILRCLAADNPGDAGELRHHSGSGILVDGVNGATIRECVATGNGGECRSDRGGPVGIWAHASREVLIEYCESHGNRSMLRDGGGFDLDGGCEDSVLRWNFAHDNDGPGLMVYTYGGAAYSDSNCRVIGNISWNDGRKGSGYAGLQIGAEYGCRITNLEVAFNTVIAPKGSVAAVRISGHAIGATILSNLVIAPKDGVLVAISGFDHRMKFEGNVYWREDGKPVFLIDTQWPIPTLESWRNSTGPDFRFVASGDRFANPRFVGKPPRSGLRIKGPRWPSFSSVLDGIAGAPVRRPVER